MVQALDTPRRRPPKHMAPARLGLIVLARMLAWCAALVGGVAAVGW